jgi:hypothetical protein
MDEVSLEPMDDDDIEMEDLDEQRAIAEAAGESDGTPLDLVNRYSRLISTSCTSWLGLFVIDGALYLYSSVLSPSAATVGFMASIELVRSCGPKFKNAPPNEYLEMYKNVMRGKDGFSRYANKGAVEAHPMFEHSVEMLVTRIKNEHPQLIWMLAYEDGHERIIQGSDGYDPAFPILLLVRCALRYNSSAAPFFNVDAFREEIDMVTSYAGEPIATAFLE